MESVEAHFNDARIVLSQCGASKDEPQLSVSFLSDITMLPALLRVMGYFVFSPTHQATLNAAVSPVPGEFIGKESPSETIGGGSLAERSVSNLGGPLPHRLPRPLRPGPIVVLTADPTFAHLGEDLTGRRQAFGIDPPVGIPCAVIYDRAGAMNM